jgi:hypothetical protein
VSAKLTHNRKDLAPTNPRGIPYAPFVDKVEDYVSSRAEVETTLKSFQEMISYVSAIPSWGFELTWWQEVSVYGAESTTAGCRTERQDA